MCRAHRIPLSFITVIHVRIGVVYLQSGDRCVALTVWLSAMFRARCDHERRGAAGLSGVLSLVVPTGSSVDGSGDMTVKYILCEMERCLLGDVCI